MSKLFRVALCVFTLYLTGCSAINVEKKYRSNSYDNRIQWIVLHYTSADFERSLHLLTNTAVSSHYLISEQPVKVYQLVDESKRAWHAGDSSWRGRTWLNATSIGIELVHPGYTEQAGERIWHDWSTEQIDSLIVLLHDILHRYQLPIESVIGHSDIAPQRKVDPGPKFPWSRLAQEGMIRWPLTTDIDFYEPIFLVELPDALWFQEQLAALGYAIHQSAEFDEQTQQVISALQMKYRPSNFSGTADAETAAILQSLTEQQKQTQEQ